MSLLTAKQAADRLGVSVRQLDRYVADGLIEPRRATPRGHRKFDEGEVAALLRGAQPAHS